MQLTKENLKMAAELRKLADAINPPVYTVTIKCKGVKWGPAAENLAIKPKPAQK